PARRRPPPTRMTTRPSRLRATFKVIRLHQWTKNALAVVPVLLAPHGLSAGGLWHAALAALSLGLSVGLSLWALPRSFLWMLGLYFAITLAYSFYLKSKVLIDVIVLAWLYTQRVLAGGFATDVSISAWLLAFSMFIFLS